MGKKRTLRVLIKVKLSFATYAMRFKHLKHNNEKKYMNVCFFIFFSRALTSNNLHWLPRGFIKGPNLRLV